MRFISGLFLAFLILGSCSLEGERQESVRSGDYADSGMDESYREDADIDEETIADAEHQSSETGAMSEDKPMSEEDGPGVVPGKWDASGGPDEGQKAGLPSVPGVKPGRFGDITTSVIPGAGSSASPPPPSEDAFLDQLRSYPIAYEFPSEGQQGMAFEVTLAIDATGDTSAVEGLPQRDIVVEASANLSRTVEATLSGAAFDIKLTNKERQRLSPLRESVWRWSVTPLQAGEHMLYLELHAVLGDEESVLLESYADNINVRVSASKPEGSRTDFIRNIISIIGGVISITLGAIALVGHIRKRKIRSGSD